MVILRASLLALFATQAVIAVADPLATDPATDPFAPSTSADTAGRKGTRNYRPGEDAATTTPSISATLKPDSISDEEKITQCMETWDKGTHITKSKWHEICKRQLNDGR
jgi:hypothetical protein